MAERIYSVVWGAPAILLILTVGIFLTIRTGFPQIRFFPKALRSFLCQKASDGGISPFRSLCIALSATIGTGNLVGVAGAICLGGPGAVLWMLICGFFGMAVKYAEAVLAVRYQVSLQGELVGGPMYMIRNGLGHNWKPMADLYCLLGIAASFGVGNLVQINTIAVSIGRAVPVCLSCPWVLGIGLTVLVGAVFWKGTESIGRVSERIVPLAAGGYVVFCILFLILRSYRLPTAFREIMLGAFDPKAVSGGMIGSLIKTVQTGCSRGVFSNESGMGTASMAHGSSTVSHPVQQGMIGILEVFLDTFVICLLTALVILTSGISIPYGTDAGADLTGSAFSTLFGAQGSGFVSAVICLFAFTTVLGWSIYGLRCTQYLFGNNSSAFYFLFHTAAVMLGTVLQTPQVWRTAEILNGLMVLPNMIVLLRLCPELVRLTKDFGRQKTV